SFDNGMLVGYGFRSPPIIAEGSDVLRNFHASDGWQRIDTTFGEATLSNFIIATTALGGGYDLGLGGDSGGALLPPEHDRMCGIQRRGLGPATAGAAFFIPEFGDDAAELDSPGNVAFLTDIIYDAKHGRFVGECAGGETDSDNDGVPDACDNCPNIQNFDQL